MKRILIFTLVLVLMLVSASPALAGNGNGNGGNGGNGNGQGGNGNTNGQQSQNGKQSQNTNQNQNKNIEHKAEFTVITGEVIAIAGTAGAGSITVLVYGGKDPSLHGREVVVQIDASTRFVMKDIGPITFEQVGVGDPVSVAIGSDGIANRVTVDAEVACIPL